MDSSALLTIAISGMVVAHLAAIATNVLSDLAWHELKQYCRRRPKRDLFDEIHEHADEVAQGVQALRLLAASLAAFTGFLWLLATNLPRLTAWPTLLLVLSVVLLALATLLWIPAALSELWGIPFLYHSWPIWRRVAWLLWPVAIGGSVVLAVLRRLKGQTDEPSDEEAFEDEIRAIVAEGQHDGFLEADAREMIEGVIELNDADVADIMTSRSDMDAMPVDLEWDQILQFVTSVGRTRIPVYGENLDDIVGILYVKDLFVELRKPVTERRPIRQILRNAWQVPLRQRLDELLKVFLQTRSHLAIVVDEYNTVAGLVTIEDVLEEIVGEIVDESDREEVAEIRKIDESSAIVHGRTHVETVNEQLGTDLPEDEDFDTIGGFIMHQLGRIPQAGESLNWRNLELQVKEATRRRVESVRVQFLADTPQHSE